MLCLLQLCFDLVLSLLNLPRIVGGLGDGSSSLGDERVAGDVVARWIRPWLVGRQEAEHIFIGTILHGSATQCNVVWIPWLVSASVKERTPGTPSDNAHEDSITMSNQQRRTVTCTAQ